MVTGVSVESLLRVCSRGRFGKWGECGVPAETPDCCEFLLWFDNVCGHDECIGKL